MEEDTNTPSSGNPSFLNFVQGKYQEALDGFNTSVQEQPNNAFHYLNRAACNYELGLYRKSIQDCDSAIAIDENLDKAYLLKGRNLLKTGKPKLARKTWRQGARVTNDVSTFKLFTSLLSGEDEEGKPRPGSVSPDPVHPSGPSSVPVPSSDSKQKEPTPLSLITDDPISTRARLQSLLGLDDTTMMAIEKASTSDIQYGFGNPKVDNFIAYGYYLVNSGQLKEGIKAFDAMLTIYPKLVAGRVGRGTAHALSYQFTQAVIDFTFAIELEPKCADAYKRRGQCLAARGDEALALNDFSKALELSPDLDTHFQRAQVYYKLKNWNKAIADFKSMIEFDSKNPNTWNYLGLCYDSIGDCNSSVNAHLKAIELKPDFKESHCNLGYTYRNWGKLGLAFKSFDKALEIDPSYSKAYHLRGFSYFAVGEHFKSISDMAKSAEIDPKHTDSYIMLGVAYHGVGNFRKCIESYDKALKLEPENPVWYQKELALWWQKKLDLPTQQYNIDLDLDAQFKEFWAKRNNWRLLKSYKKQPPLSTSIPDVETRVEPYTTNSPKERLLRFSEYYGNMLHTDSQGYVKNIRQLRMAGLATIQVAQVLRDFWFKNNDNIEPNLSTHPKARQSGKINWRFPFDLVVRWRQISEPNDPVWWVDLLTPEQFKEGFGSHTPMIIGQLHVVRYSPMVKVAFPLMKEGMLTQLNLSEEKQKIVQKATTLTELYNVVGKDFYIATPCESFLYPSTILEGTRITLQKSEPEGFEFSIRTAGTPARWEQYDAEMTSIWNKLTEAVREKPLDMDKVSNLILTFEFFWYNYMPLSRGSAAAGLIVMISMFLAIGIKIDTSIPKDFLLDWEGILRPKAADFIKVVSAWLYPARKPIDINQFDELPPVITTFPTLRDMTTVLNLYSQ